MGTRSFRRVGMSNVSGVQSTSGRDLHAALPPRASSVRAARELIRSLFAETTVKADADTALLLVSELVSNAVLHARGAVDLKVTARAGTLRVEVSDGSSAMPLVLVKSVQATTGRGLRLVERLADSWGFDVAEEGGKTVWFELGSHLPERENAASLAPGSRLGSGTEPGDLLGRYHAFGGARRAADEPATRVFLRRLPLLLQDRATEHHDDLVREFMLLATRLRQPVRTPPRLRYLIKEFGDHFAAAGNRGDDLFRRARAQGLNR